MRGQAAVCHVPGLMAVPDQLGIPKGQRPRVCGWLQRAIAHRMLHGRQTAERLAAVFALALAG